MKSNLKGDTKGNINRIICMVLLCMGMIFVMTGCDNKDGASSADREPVYCDKCGKDITKEVRSDITDDWIIFCGDCSKQMEPIVQPSK